MDGSHKSYASSYTLSTDHTVLGCTPPQEQPHPKPSFQPTKNVSQVKPEDLLYPHLPQRKITTFERSPNVRDSLVTRPNPRPDQSSPRNSLPWLKHQPRTAPVQSISLKSPKHAKSPAQSVNPPVYANLASQSSLPWHQQQSIADSTSTPIQKSRNAGSSAEVKPPIYIDIATQTSPILSDAEDYFGNLERVSSGQSTDPCTLCAHQENPGDAEWLSPRNHIVCPKCQIPQASLTAKRDEAEVVCSLCSTRRPSNINKRKLSVVCSICSTRRPSAANVRQSKKDCTWCLLFQLPRPGNGDMLCSICSSLQKENGNHNLINTNKQDSPASMYEAQNYAAVPDPIKRVPPTQSNAQSVSTKSPKQSQKEYISAKMQAPLPPVPTEIDHDFQKGGPSVPVSHVSSVSSSTLGIPRSQPKVSNKEVFRGLQVATNAACDEDIDQWVFEVTGRRVRDFLASLSMLEGLGTGLMAGVARRAAKHRRTEVRVLEEMRKINLHDRN